MVQVQKEWKEMREEEKVSLKQIANMFILISWLIVLIWTTLVIKVLSTGTKITVTPIGLQIEMEK